MPGASGQHNAAINSGNVSYDAVIVGRRPARLCTKLAYP
jgi:hypothetical protein